MTPIDASSDGLEIFVISLPCDAERRSRLRSQFPRYWSRFSVVDAVDLREPAKADGRLQPAPCRRIARNPLTPAEAGCALSHLKALEYAAASKARSVLILEDDVVGNDEAIERISVITRRLPTHHFLLCGGQEGLRGRRYLYGVPQDEEYSLLLPIALRFAARACAYALTPSMAQVIINQQRQCLDRADNWRELLRGEREVYFAQCLRHPVALEQSHLECGRVDWRRRSVWKRIWSDGVIYTAVSQVLKLGLVIASVFGLKRL